MRKVYKLENLDCAHCATLMEDGIRKIEGVNSANISFMTLKMVIDMVEGNEEKILKEAIKLIKRIEPDCEVMV